MISRSEVSGRTADVDAGWSSEVFYVLDNTDAESVEQNLDAMSAISGTFRNFRSPLTVLHDKQGMENNFPLCAGCI